MSGLRLTTWNVQNLFRPAAGDSAARAVYKQKLSTVNELRIHAARPVAVLGDLNDGITRSERGDVVELPPECRPLATRSRWRKFTQVLRRGLLNLRRLSRPSVSAEEPTAPPKAALPTSA